MLWLITEEEIDLTLYHNLGIEIDTCSIKSALAYLETQDILGVDTETTGFFPQVDDILLLQIGTETDQYVIDAVTVDITPFKNLLETKTIILHNAKFDLRFFFKHNIFPRTNVYDSFLAESVLTCGLTSFRRGLDAVVLRYVGAVLNKETRGKIHYLGRFDPEVIQYAADDVKYLIPVKKAQEKLLNTFKLEKAIQLDNLAMPAIAYIEYFGFKLDTDVWRIKMQKDLDNLNQVAAELEQITFPFTSGEINWMSPKQVIQFFKSIGVDVSYMDKKTKDWKESVDKKILKKQINKFPKDSAPYNIIKTYLEYRRLEKIVNTYGESILKITEFFPDKRVRTTYSQIMRTGRMSSGGKYGKDKNALQLPNMQNIPREGEERKCFVPEDGNVFIVADYSGQENLILAEFSQDKEFYSYQINPEKDLHSFIARLIHLEKLKELSDREITELYPELRQFSKGATFAFGYGGNNYTIQQNLSLSPEVSIRTYEGYKNKFPGLQKYFKRVAGETLRNGYILINKITGRKSFIPDFRDFQMHLSNAYEGEMTDPDIWTKKGSIVRSSQNYPIQGTGSDMIKLSLYKMYEWICDNNYWGIVLICNTVHDEIVLECPKKLEEVVSSKLLEIMKESAKKFCPSIPMKIGYKISNKWTH